MNTTECGEVGPTVCAPAVLPLSMRQSADACFQSLLLQHAGGRAGGVEIQHLSGTYGEHVHAVKHDKRLFVQLLLCVMDKNRRHKRKQLRRTPLPLPPPLLGTADFVPLLLLRPALESLIISVRNAPQLFLNPHFLHRVYSPPCREPLKTP